MSSRPRRHLDLISLNLVLLLAASIIGERAYGLYRNSLAVHPDWKSTKSLLSKRVMGMEPFEDGPQTLAHNRLNLGVWWGFQEVRYARALRLTQLDAAVRFEPEGYVNVLYDVGAAGFSGVRISARRELPSVQFRASPEGEFVAVGRLALPAPVMPNEWHAVRIRFDSTRASVFLDGRSIGAFERVEQPQRVGFRGGQRAAWVDDVVLRLVDGATIRESFRNTRGSLRRTLLLFSFGGMAVLMGGLLVGRSFSIPARNRWLGTVIVNLGAIVLAGCAYLLQFSSSTRYAPAGGTVRRAEVQGMTEAQRRILTELEAEYHRPPADGVYRILFLGSSQTWGAGALTPDDIWVRRLEGMLNHDGRQRSFECINAGISGLTSPQVLELLRELLPLRAQAAVVNLSNNDVDTARFRANLDSIVATLANAGIRGVLLLEPNSPERRITDSPHGDLAVKHKIVSEVGRARGIPVIDLQRYLAERNQTGFLWWDFVHLTSLGQRLVAEKLHTDLPTLLHLR